MRAQEEGEAEAIDAWFINSSVFVMVVDKEGLTSTGDARFCPVIISDSLLRK